MPTPRSGNDSVGSGILLALLEAHKAPLRSSQGGLLSREKSLMEGLYLLANLPPRKGRQKNQPKWSTQWENAYQFQLFPCGLRLARNFVTNFVDRFPKLVAA